MALNALVHATVALVEVVVLGDAVRTSILADVEARGHPAGTDGEVGPIATELAAADSMLLQLLRSHPGLRNIEEAK